MYTYYIIITIAIGFVEEAKEMDTEDKFGIFYRFPHLL